MRIAVIFIAIVCSSTLEAAAGYSRPYCRSAVEGIHDLDISIECLSNEVVINLNFQDNNNFGSLLYLCTDSNEINVQEYSVIDVGFFNPGDLSYSRPLGATTCQIYGCYQDTNLFSNDYFEIQNHTCTFNQDAQTTTTTAEPESVVHVTTAQTPPTALEILPSSPATSNHATNGLGIQTKSIVPTSTLITSTSNAEAATTQSFDPQNRDETTYFETTTIPVTMETSTSSPETPIATTLPSEPDVTEQNTFTAQVTPSPGSHPSRGVDQVTQVITVVTVVILAIAAVATLILALFCFISIRCRYKRSSLDYVLDGADDKIDPYFAPIDISARGSIVAGSLHSIFDSLSKEVKAPEKKELSNDDEHSHILTPEAMEGYEDASNISSVFTNEPVRQNEVQSDEVSASDSSKIQQVSREVLPSGYVSEASPNLPSDSESKGDNFSLSDSLTDSTGSEAEPAVSTTRISTPSGYITQHQLTSRPADLHFLNTTPPHQSASMFAPPSTTVPRVTEHRKRAVEPIMSISSCSSGYVSEFTPTSPLVRPMFGEWQEKNNNEGSNLHRSKRSKYSATDSSTQHKSRNKTNKVKIPTERTANNHLQEQVGGYIISENQTSPIVKSLTLDPTQQLANETYSGRRNDPDYDDEVAIWCNSDEEQLAEDEDTENSKVLAPVIEELVTHTFHPTEGVVEGQSSASAINRSSCYIPPSNFDLSNLPPTAYKTSSEMESDFSAYSDCGLTLDPDLFDPIESDFNESDAESYSTTLNSESENINSETEPGASQSCTKLDVTTTTRQLYNVNFCIPSLLSPTNDRQSFATQKTSEDNLSLAKFYFPH